MHLFTLGFQDCWLCSKPKKSFSRVLPDLIIQGQFYEDVQIQFNGNKYFASFTTITDYLLR